MKHHYPQYKFRLLKDASGPSKNPEHYDPTLFGLRLNALRKEFDTRQMEDPVFALQECHRAPEDYDIISVLTTANAEHALWRGEGIHTFVDPDTENVIVRAISKLDSETLARYRPKMGIGVIYRAHKNPVMYNFADEGSSACINDEVMGIFRMDELRELAIPDNEEDIEDALLCLRETMRFVSGCFMMAECFPGVFVDGLPDFCKHPAWFRKLPARGMQITKISRSVCPHIRTGHFRLLSSERYVNKKGQVIFVKPAMVGGKAEHTELEGINAEPS
jgi:hypothetical protein